MKKSVLCMTGAIIMAFSLMGCASSGEKAVVSEVKESSEQRIIATSPATCDIMDRLDIDLVGVPNTTVSKIPERYNDVERVGTPMSPDMEIVKSLKPTDVIGPNTLQGDLEEKYKNIGVNATFIDLTNVPAMYKSIEFIGEKYDRVNQAKALNDEFKDFMNEYSKKNEGKEKPKVLVLMGLPGDYIVATDKSYCGSLVELAGAVNVFTDDTDGFLSINTEELFNSDPDIIVRTAHAMPDKVKEMFAKEFSENDIWKHFRAVKDGRVYDLDYKKFGMSATFNYTEALDDLQTILYGEQ